MVPCVGPATKAPRSRGVADSQRCARPSRRAGRCL